MTTLWQDVRYGLRTMRGNLGFTAVAVVALALGVGANTAIFSVVNAVLLRPLQYPNAERIVAVEELGPQGNRIQITPANFLDWREQSTVFEHLSAILQRTANLAVGDEAERIDLAMTSADFFDVFGVRPARGRFFQPEEEKAGHAPVVVIGRGLWQRRFGGDPEVVGRQITLDGRAYTVVGVAPEGFSYPDRTEAWVPPFSRVPTLSEQMDVARARGFGFLSAVGVLKPGATLKGAQAEMEAITARLRQQYPESNNKRFDRVVSLHTHLVGESSRALLLLLGAVALVLAVACANVANLLLARAAGAAGLLLGWWGVDLMKGLLPADFPRLADVGVDPRVLGFTLLVSCATGVAFGLAPALQFTKPDLHSSLKESGRGSTGGARAGRLRGLLIVSEVALSLVLLVGAGLMFRSFMRLQSVELGFRPQRVLTFSLTPSGTNFRADAQYSNFYRDVAERVRDIPGVEAVGVINTLPLAKGPTAGYQVEGPPPLRADEWPSVNYRSVSPDYFNAVGVTVLRGRAPDERDVPGAPLAVAVNE